MNEVFIVGIGAFPYQSAGRTSYIEMGTAAVREALRDSQLEWTSVQTAYVGQITLGLGAGWNMLRHLGDNEMSVTEVSNASASGSSAFRQAVADVASGKVGSALAMGVDVGTMVGLAAEQDSAPLSTPGPLPPLAVFALESQRYMHKFGATSDDLARVVVKNRHNGSLNPYAQRRTPKTLEEVQTAKMIADPLTALHVCPVGEGAAATIVVSGEFMKKHGLDKSRAVKVLGSVASVDTTPPLEDFPIANLTAKTSKMLYEQTGVGPEDLDVVELHEAFSVEEFLHTEAMSLYSEGAGPDKLKEGYTSIGGSVAVNPSGGLLAMGHPFGPTGIGQIAEITRQIRGEATGRQHPNTRTGVAHMVGVGEVCVMHMLQGV